MEQEQKLVDFGNKTVENYFKLDYKGQKINNNQNFINFKEEMLRKNNYKGRIFFCKNEDIYFYYNDSEYPYFHGICPSCQQSICYFCSKPNNYTYDLCCYSKRIHYIFYVDALVFFKYPKDGVNDYHYQPKFKEHLLLALTPVLNLIFFMGGIHTAIYKLDTKMVFEDNKDDYLNFEQYIKGCGNRRDFFILIVALDIGATIILATIPFLILDIISTILIVIISIPFKFYPLKYLFGIGFVGWLLN